jgi:hypothetical protein
MLKANPEPPHKAISRKSIGNNRSGTGRAAVSVKNSFVGDNHLLSLPSLTGNEELKDPKQRK